MIGPQRHFRQRLLMNQGVDTSLLATSHKNAGRIRLRVGQLTGEGGPGHDPVSKAPGAVWTVQRQGTGRARHVKPSTSRINRDHDSRLTGRDRPIFSRTFIRS